MYKLELLEFQVFQNIEKLINSKGDVSVIRLNTALRLTSPASQIV